MLREWSWTSNSGLAWKLAKCRSLQAHVAPQSASLLTCTLNELPGGPCACYKFGELPSLVSSLPGLGHQAPPPHPASLPREVQDELVLMGPCVSTGCGPGSPPQATLQWPWPSSRSLGRNRHPAPNDSLEETGCSFARSVREPLSHEA